MEGPPHHRLPPTLASPPSRAPRAPHCPPDPLLLLHYSTVVSLLARFHRRTSILCSIVSRYFTGLIKRSTLYTLRITALITPFIVYKALLVSWFFVVVMILFFMHRHSVPTPHVGATRARETTLPPWRLLAGLSARARVLTPWRRGERGPRQPPPRVPRAPWRWPARRAAGQRSRGGRGRT